MRIIAEMFLLSFRFRPVVVRVFKTRQSELFSMETEI